VRYADWQARFWREMDRQRTLPFVWGERDCVLFAATMGDAVSDAEYVRRARAAFTWSNTKEAIRLQRETDLRALTETVMGPLVAWPRLTMGDFGLVFDEKRRLSIAVHDGCGFVGAVELGVQRIPFRYVQGGWHVT
jgi:hypothetical protein